ncbi:hypothetical protein GCM10020220_044800 [Nonomuraea rubra]
MNRAWNQKSRRDRPLGEPLRDADGVLTKNGRTRVPDARSQAATAPAASPIRPAHTIAAPGPAAGAHCLAHLLAEHSARPRSSVAGRSAAHHGRARDSTALITAVDSASPSTCHTPTIPANTVAVSNWRDDTVR